MKNQPQTWEELKDAGYVTELDEVQIAIAKDKFNPRPNWKPRTPEQDRKRLHDLEAKTRQLK